MHYLHMEAPVKVIHRDLKSRNGKVAILWNDLHLLLPINVAFKYVPEFSEQAECLTNAMVVIKAALVEAQKSCCLVPSSPSWACLKFITALASSGALWRTLSTCVLLVVIGQESWWSFQILPGHSLLLFSIWEGWVPGKAGRHRTLNKTQ